MSKIFFKLLFKAMLPVLAMVGIMSYMMHLQGQDPLLPIKHVAGGLEKKFSAAGRSLQKAVTDSPPSSLSTADYSSNKSSGQRIFRWTDADGQIHFATARPTQQTQVDTLTFNPNQNVVAPVSMPVAEAPADAEDANAEPVPGMASLVPLTVSPSQLKKMFKDMKEINLARQMPSTE